MGGMRETRTVRRESRSGRWWIEVTLGLALLVTSWAALLLVPAPIGAAGSGDGPYPVVIETPAARLAIDRKGGVLSAFQLHRDNLNPLVGLGHFLCLDRWGQPSAAEEKNGMPFHGEASKVEWKIVRPPMQRAGAIEIEMAAHLPLAGIAVKRRARLAANEAVVTIREEVTNTNKLGRVYNMVQHPTIGPPFLDETTLVDANAARGFLQSSPLPNPERPSVRWPSAQKSGRRVDMRRLTDDPDPNVVSYVIDEPYGWVTACNPGRRLLLGYLWKTEEYPWFNAWRHVEKGKPAYRGLEFGTTGLHQPYPTLVAKGRIFERPLFAYLDAGETVARSFAMFLVRTPADYRGVAQVAFTAGQLALRERGPGREIVITVGDPFGK
jgi:hypothetical protein